MTTIEELQNKLRTLRAQVEESETALARELSSIIKQYLPEDCGLTVEAKIGWSSVDARGTLRLGEQCDSFDLICKTDPDEDYEVTYLRMGLNSYTIAEPFVLVKMRLALGLAEHELDIKEAIFQTVRRTQTTIDERDAVTAELTRLREEEWRKTRRDTIAAIQVGDYYAYSYSIMSVYRVVKVTPKRVRIKAYHIVTVGEDRLWEPWYEELWDKENMANDIISGRLVKTEAHLE